MKTFYKLSFIDPENVKDEDFKRQNKVWAIKHLRMLAHPHELGLKAAVAHIDSLLADLTSTVVVESVQDEDSVVRSSIQQLAGVGIAVVPLIDETLAKIKQAAFEALEMGNHTLSRDLLNVLVQHGGK